MATRRYRINFNVSFEQTVEADNRDEARAIATQLATMPNIALAGSGETASCHWNTIEPLDAELP